MASTRDDQDEVDTNDPQWKASRDAWLKHAREALNGNTEQDTENK